MLQIWIPEYTNFRAFSPFFSSFSLLCSSSFSLFSSTMVYLFLVTFLYGKKSRKKIILGRSICPPIKQFKNHKENDENLWLYNRPKLRSFEAFITIIEISIFGFENSTLNKRHLTQCMKMQVPRFFKIIINVILNFLQQISIHSNSHCGTFLWRY